MASDLSRARETAEIITRPHGLGVRMDRRLRELDFGSWEGKTYAEIERSDPAMWKAWQQDPMGAAPPGGECLTQLALRLQDFRRSLMEPGDATILLTGHRGSFRVLLCLLLHLQVERHWDFRLDIASLTEVDLRSSGATLVRLSETCAES